MSIALKNFIRDVPDFPKPGIVFKDIGPLLGDSAAFAAANEALLERVSELRFDAVVAIESRGFLFAAPLALRRGCALVPVRKSGKLPGPLHAECYDLEYGAATLEIQRDGLRAGQRALIVDDVLATGGTAAAAAKLVAKTGATGAGFLFLIELDFLAGRNRLKAPCLSVIHY